MSFILTPLVSEDFTQQPNQTPIDPTKWKTITGESGGPFEPLDIVNGAMVCSTSFANQNIGGAVRINAFLPSNQYGEFTISSIIGTIGLGILSDITSDDGYEVSFQTGTPGPGNIMTVELTNDGNDGGVLDSINTPVNSEDKFTIGAFNGTIFVLMNGVQILTAVDNEFKAGGVYIEMSDDAGTPLGCKVSSFAAGAVTLTPNYMPLVFTQLAADTFVRANANNLGSNWQKGTGLGNIKIVSNAAEAAQINSSNDSYEFYKGVSFPSDVYAEVKISSFIDANQPDVEILLRADATFDNGYYMDLETNGDGTCDISINVANAGVISLLFENVALPILAGDVFRLAIIGSSLTLYQNGTLVGSATDSSIASGVGPGILISVNDTVGDINLNNFAAGSVTQAASVFSVTDSRNYGNFPNHDRNVQGTLTYDVPSVFSLRWWFDTLFNRTQPLPLDSRTSVPTDSRTAPNIPENSRTN